MVIGYAVYALTGASSWVGVSLALYFVPMFVLGLMAGAVTDWAEDRRKLLRHTELALSVILALYALTLVTVGTHLAIILGFSVISGSIRALHQTLRGTIAYDISGPEKSVTALGRLNLGSRASQFAGAALAGLVAREVGVGGAIALLAVVHLAGAASFTWLSAEPARARSTHSIRTQIKELFATLGSNRALATLVLVTGAVEVLGFSFVTALPELAAQRFGLGPDGLGSLHAARAVGGLVAAGILASSLVGLVHGRHYLVVVCFFGVFMLGLAGAPLLWLALVALMGIAGLAVATDVLSQAMMQYSVPDEMRGRAMGTWVFAIGAAPIGHLALGLLIDAIGVGLALALNGTLLLCLAYVARNRLASIRQLGNAR